MLSLLDPDEMNFVYQMPEVIDSGSYVWLGQSRQNGQFQWVDGSPWEKWVGVGEFGSMPWDVGEPSDIGDCTHINFAQSHELKFGKWSMFDCDISSEL